MPIQLCLLKYHLPVKVDLYISIFAFLEFKKMEVYKLRKYF